MLCCAKKTRDGQVSLFVLHTLPEPKTKEELLVSQSELPGTSRPDCQITVKSWQSTDSSLGFAVFFVGLKKPREAVVYRKNQRPDRATMESIRWWVCDGGEVSEKIVKQKNCSLVELVHERQANESSLVIWTNRKADGLNELDFSKPSCITNRRMTNLFFFLNNNNPVVLQF